MADDLSIMRRNAYLNNSYDQDSTHTALLESFQNSYSYLYELQRKEVEYEEFHYLSSNRVNVKESGHLYVLNGRVYFNIFYNTIHIENREAFYRNTKNPADASNTSGGYVNNENYKTNKFYYKDEFTFEDMINNSDMFKRVPIVIIDDKALYDYKIKFEKDHFTVEVPMRPNDVLEDRRDNQNGIYFTEHKVQVMVLPNNLCKRTTVTSLSLTDNTTHYYLSILNSDVKSVMVNDTFAKNGIDILDELNNGTGMVFMMIHFPNVDGSYTFGTGLYPLVPSTNTTKTTTLVPTWFKSTYDRTVANDSENKNIKITYFYLSGAHLHRFDYGSTAYNYGTKRGPDENDQKYNLILPYNAQGNFYNQPIPVENFLIYKAEYEPYEDSRRLNFFGLVKNTDTLTLHYPNIYEITKTNENYSRYYTIYFYNDKNENSHKYFNEYGFFYDYIYYKWSRNETNYAKRLNFNMTAIYCDTISKLQFTEETYDAFKADFDKLMNINDYTGYDYYKYKYGDRYYLDFIKIHPEYDIRSYEDFTFKDVTQNHFNALRDYVRIQNKLYHYTYYIDISVDDLQSRLRSSTSYDGILDDSGTPYIFDTSCYVFTFSNKSTSRNNKTDLRLYVNGMYVGDFYQYRLYYRDYIYIPIIYLDNSINHIELEVVPSYEHVSPLSFSAINETKEITLLESNDGIYPTISDIYCMTPVKHIDQIKDESISAKDNTILTSDVDVSLPFGDWIPNDRAFERYNTNDVIQVTVHYDDNINPDLLPITNGHRYTRLKSFKLTAKSNNILNKTIWFRIAKIPHKIKYTVTDDGYQFIEIPERNFHFDPSYLRVFINGKLVPDTNYLYVSDHYYPRIHLFEKCYVGDNVYIDISPYRYKKLVEFDSINDYIISSSGVSYAFINLSEYLSRPFDVENYDVFINGYKVSANNMLSYYGTGLILFSLITTSNLVIYEKERDVEYYDKFTNYFSYNDVFTSDYIKESDKVNMINGYINKNKNRNAIVGNVSDTIPGPEIFHNSDYQMVYMFYRTELIRKKFVSPDIRQFNKLFIEMDYNLIYENYIETTDEMPRTSHGQNVLHLNPDKYIEGEEPPEDVDPGEYEEVYKVYGVGHLYEDLDPSIEQAAIAGTNTPVIIFDPDLSFN